MCKVIQKFQSFNKWMEIPFKMKNLELSINIFLRINTNESRGVLLLWMV